jgi:AsmA protein
MTTGSKRKATIWKVLGIAIAVLAIIVIVLPFVIDANQFRPKVESELTRALGREVKLGNLKFSLLSGSVGANDIAIADDPKFNQSPFVSAKSLQVGVELTPLIFSGALQITSIALAKPEITLVRSATGDWNFSSLGSESGARPNQGPSAQGSASSSPDVSVGELKITDGRVTVLREGGRLKSYVYDKVNITARDLSFSSIFPFVLTGSLPGGGNLKLEGKAGPITRNDASLTPFTATLDITHYDLISSGFIEPSSGLAGLFGFQGSVSSDGKQMQSKGSATAEKLQLVKGGSPAGRPVSIAYAVRQDLRSQSGILDEATVTCGKAVAGLTGSFSMAGDSMTMKLKLHGESMPLPDLEALLPAAGVTLPRGASLQGGTLNADLKTEGPLEKLVTEGTIEISNTRLDGFDLRGQMAAVASLAGSQASTFTEIQRFAAGMRVTPEGIQVSGLTLMVPSLGELTGDGTVAANNSLDFKMLARLNAAGGLIGGLSRLAGIQGSNAIDVPFFVRGTALNPSFVPDVKGAAGNLLKSATSGSGSKAGQSNTTSSILDALRGALQKKKK